MFLFIQRAIFPPKPPFGISILKRTANVGNISVANKKKRFKMFISRFSKYGTGNSPGIGKRILGQDFWFLFRSMPPSKPAIRIVLLLPPIRLYGLSSDHRGNLSQSFQQSPKCSKQRKSVPLVITTKRS